MVQQIPDPPKDEAEVSSPADLAVVMATDSEDEEDTPYAGYSMLPTDPSEEPNDSEDENSFNAISNPVEPSTFDKSTTDEKIALWSAPQEEKPDMSREQSDAVLKAMEGFNLPASATPPWAKNVGEDVWKTHLLDKIRKT